MPDYNRQATMFWWLVVAGGAAVLALALSHQARADPEVWLQVAAGCVLAMGAGLFPLRVPGTRNSFTASDIAIYLLLLALGPSAAALAAAAETGVAAWRTSRRWTSRLFSPCASALSIYLTGSLLHALLARQEPAGSPAAAVLLGTTLAVALLQFLLSLQLFSGVLRLKRGEPLLRLRDAFDDFRWVTLAYLGSAMVAGLLYLAWRDSGGGVLIVMVPLVALLLVTLHFYFRQQEAAEAVREAQAAAGEREAELTAQAAQAAERHMRELQASERRFHAAFTHASIGMALLGFDGRILQANPALAALLGWTREEIEGRVLSEFVDTDDRAALHASLGLSDGREFEAFASEVRCRHRDGSRVWAAVHCSFFTEPDSDSPCLILQAQDITARRRAEDGLQHLAFHDPLTGLPNRRRFLECLTGVVTRNQAGPTVPFAVMFIDFDRFKLVNDSLGHGAGDELLVQLARRIQEKLRPHDIVARLGGDEFAILADGIENERAAVVLAERLTEALRKPFDVQGVTIVATASIGITFSSLGYADADAVLRDADIAMYKAKGMGRARYALFDASLHEAVSARLRLEGELRQAVDDGLLSVQYQPLLELDGRRLAGFEALVRWQHPSAGLLPPDAFLGIAEEADLMVRLTDFVLHCACHQLRRWQLADPACAELTMSVNVSAADLLQPAFVARVGRAIVEAGLRPQHLTLELTENMLMAHIDGARDALVELRRMGVQLAVDDFGTGHSSLSRLAQLPIDCLKIDRSFIERLVHDSDQSAIVGAIVQLGGALHKRVVAEGIESDAQRRVLHDLGCRFGQGFHLGSPLSAGDTEGWMQARRTALH